MAFHAKFQRNISVARRTWLPPSVEIIHLLLGCWGGKGELPLNFQVPGEVRDLVYRDRSPSFWLATIFYRPLMPAPNKEAPGHYHGFRVGDLRFRNFHPGYYEWLKLYIFPPGDRPLSPGTRAWQDYNNYLFESYMLKEIQMYDEERCLIYRNALYASYPTSRLPEQVIIDAGLGGVYPWDQRPETLAGSPGLRYFAYIFASRELRTLWDPQRNFPSERSTANFNRIGKYIIDKYACQKDTHLLDADDEENLTNIMGDICLVRHFFHELRCFLASFLHARFDPDHLGSYSTRPWGRAENLGGPQHDEDYRRANMPPAND